MELVGERLDEVLCAYPGHKAHLFRCEHYLGWRIIIEHKGCDCLGDYGPERVEHGFDLISIFAMLQQGIQWGWHYLI